jgi:hypothetical protein
MSIRSETHCLPLELESLVQPFYVPGLSEASLQHHNQSTALDCPVWMYLGCETQCLRSELEYLVQKCRVPNLIVVHLQ